MRKEKQFLLDEVHEKAKKAPAFILLNYQQMNPNLSYDFRVRLGQTEAELEIVGKRLFIKAAELIGQKFNREEIQGHLGIVFAYGDSAKATKTVVDFNQQNGDFFTVLGGLFEGRLCSAKDIETLSKISSKDELRAQFLGLLEAAPSQLLAVMEALVNKSADSVDSQSEK